MRRIICNVADRSVNNSRVKSETCKAGLIIIYKIKIMITIITNLISLFTRIAFGTQSIKIKLELELITTNTVTDSNDEIRRMDFHFDNFQSLEGDNTIEGIYNSLFNNEDFINTFTNRSIVIITSGTQYNTKVSFNYHPNVYLPLGVETTYARSAIILIK